MSTHSSTGNANGRQGKFTPEQREAMMNEIMLRCDPEQARLARNVAIVLGESGSADDRDAVLAITYYFSQPENRGELDAVLAKLSF